MSYRFAGRAALGLFLLVAGMASAHALAYFVTFTPNGQGTCDANGFDIPIVVAYNVPSPGPLDSTDVDTLNGVTVFNGPDQFALAGSGSYNAGEVKGPDTGFPANLPYNYERVRTYFVDGLPISRIDIKFTCAAGAAVTNASITNRQLAPNLVPTLDHSVLILLVVVLMLGGVRRLRRARV